jgi:hypothetical protein
VRSWNNQFYVLDILDAVSERSDFDSLIVLDADCVWARPADGFLSDLTRFGILTLELAHREHDLINWISRHDLKRAAESLLGKPLGHAPHYVGGEIFACKRALLGQVRQLAERLWTMTTNASGEPPLREEAHLLSIVYDLMNIAPGTADAHIKRMWTTFHFHNVTAEDMESGRCIWHLPAEKKSGFARLFPEVVRPDSEFWQLPPEAVLNYLAKTMGVPRRGAQKLLRDFSAKIAERTLGIFKFTR